MKERYPMNNIRFNIFQHKEDLRSINNSIFFHSKILFEVYEQCPKMRPLMIVGCTEEGDAVCQLLAVVRQYHCRIYGEGWYAPQMTGQEEQLFKLMLDLLLKHLGKSVLFTEISNLKSKMFGYKVLRTLGFTPVKWMSIHNSLHNKSPEERLPEKTRQKIDHALMRGATAHRVSDEEELKAFCKLMNTHHLFKPRKYIPEDLFFKMIDKIEEGELLVTKIKEKVIGCCAIAYSEKNAYLWYSAFLRKTYLKYHPDTLTVWSAIQTAYRRGCSHVYFMDVGLPYMKNTFREFIMSFGGKPVSTYRWFYTPYSWINKCLYHLFCS